MKGEDLPELTLEETIEQLRTGQTAEIPAGRVADWLEAYAQIRKHHSQVEAEALRLGEIVRKLGGSTVKREGNEDG